MSISIIQDKYKWPNQKPDVPENHRGFWVDNAGYNGPIIKERLGPSATIAVELGSWLGCSTKFILDKAPNATVIAIDHWEGSAEHHRSKWARHFLPTLYETFLVNMWNYRNRLIPMRTTTIDGLNELADNNISPDLIYVDASHEYDDVIADVKLCIERFPNAQIVGDDWNWWRVNKAVKECVEKYPYLVVKGNVSVWWLENVG